MKAAGMKKAAMDEGILKRNHKVLSPGAKINFALLDD